LAYLHSTKFKAYEFEAIETPGGRYYKTPGGLFESITTALGRNEEKKIGLKQWRLNIGEKEAARILRVSGQRGTALHDIAEKYLKNDSNHLVGHMADAISMFYQLKPILDKAISVVYLQECPLYNTKFKLAGRCDCIAEVNKKNTIIDFKTSRRQKTRAWIHDYFLQASAYSFMFEEMYGEKIEQILILIAVEDGKPQIFADDPYKYITDTFFLERT